jgi:hypothetical protein
MGGRSRGGKASFSSQPRWWARSWFPPPEARHHTTMNLCRASSAGDDHGGPPGHSFPVARQGERRGSASSLPRPFRGNTPRKQASEGREAKPARLVSRWCVWCAAGGTGGRFGPKSGCPWKPETHLGRTSCTREAAGPNLAHMVFGREWGPKNCLMESPGFHGGGIGAWGR